MCWKADLRGRGFYGAMGHPRPIGRTQTIRVLQVVETTGSVFGLNRGIGRESPAGQAPEVSPTLRGVPVPIVRHLEAR